MAFGYTEEKKMRAKFAVSANLYLVLMLYGLYLYDYFCVFKNKIYVRIKCTDNDMT